MSSHDFNPALVKEVQGELILMQADGKQYKIKVLVKNWTITIPTDTSHGEMDFFCIGSGAPERIK